MTERAICPLAAAFLLGILWSRYRSPWLAVILLAELLYLAAALIWRYGKMAAVSAAVRVLACLVFFGAGMVRLKQEQEVQKEYEALWNEGETLTVQGWISKKEEKSQTTVYYLSDILATAGNQVYPVNGILIYSSDNTYQPGCRLWARGRYESFQLPRNEGNFNEKQYYQSKKIAFKLAAQQTRILPGQKKFQMWLYRLREKWKAILQQGLPEKEAGTLSAMLLGDKALLDPEEKALYQQAGISHILAISGLHVSIFGMGVFRLLRKLGLSKKTGAVLALGVVYSFGTLSGMEVSTLRAVVMFGLSMGAEALGYAYDSPTALSLGGIVQLWENPFLIEYAGFLFSYGAVLGAAVVAPVMRSAMKDRERRRQEKKESQRQKETKNQGWKEDGGLQGGKNGNSKNEEKTPGRRRNKLLDTLYVSACIQLTTLPLTLYFYYEMPCYGILTNACILPFMGLLLYFGIGGVAAGMFSQTLGKLLFTPAVWILRGNEKICSFFLALPGAVRITGQPKLSTLILYYGVLAAGLWLMKRRGRLYPLAGIGLALWCVTVHRTAPSFEVDMLDVGQGDGIFLQAENGESFFLDGGSSDVKKVGEYRILPFLKYRGITGINFWMISHGDADHISGLKEILTSGYPVQYLVLSKYMVQDEAWQELTEIARASGCRIVAAGPGDTFGTKETRFEVLYPAGEGILDRNAASMVLGLQHQGFTGIFTGDIGSGEEQKMLGQEWFRDFARKQGSRGITLYKAAHHGSNGSNSQPFLEALSPKAAVVSCGAGNRYGHPGKEAVERMEEACKGIYYTMDSGQIRISWENGELAVREWMKEISGREGR